VVLTNEWWQRRIFTRAIKNIQDQRPGFRTLSEGIDDVHEFYKSHKVNGTLSLEEIQKLIIRGWY
ncbi:MAG: hypothetical protein N2C14_09710, partial [Planctomycetales bacterium]